MPIWRTRPQGGSLFMSGYAIANNPVGMWTMRAVQMLAAHWHDRRLIVILQEPQASRLPSSLNSLQSAGRGMWSVGGAEDAPHSLRDIVSPVAKEVVASRIDADDVLILSRFSGEASAVSDALLVHLFAEEEIETATRHALRLSVGHRRRGMRRIRRAAAGKNVHRWAGKIGSSLLRFEFPKAGYCAAGEALPQGASASAAPYSDSAFGSEYAARL